MTWLIRWLDTAWRPLALVAALALATCLFIAASRPNASTPTTGAQDAIAGPYQMQVTATFGGMQVLAWDSRTGQAWLLVASRTDDAPPGRWIELPPMPAEMEGSAP